MMEMMFQRQDYPFYRFGDIMYLNKIPKNDWIPFICDRFSTDGKQINVELAEKLVDMVECHPSYVQQLSWILWCSVTNEASEEDLKDAFEQLINTCQATFVAQTENLSSKQIGMLKAIANGVEEGFSRRAILDKYRLGVSSNVARIRTTLLEHDLICKEADGRLVIEDPVFRRWILQCFKSAA